MQKAPPERIRFPQRRVFAESGAANAAFRYAPPVKRRLERSAERDKRKIINILSADHAQSKRGAHSKSSLSLIFIISLLTTNRTLP